MTVNAVLGAGFLGAPMRLGSPRGSWQCAFETLSTHSPFAALAEAEASLAEGEVLAGYLSYECVTAIEPHLHLPPPPVSAPAAWFATFTETEPFDPLQALSAREASIHPAAVELGASCTDYSEQVREVQQRIAAGDVFQVNLSHRQTAWFDPEDPEWPQKLPLQDALNARFGAVLAFEDYSVISASPELFLSLEGGRLVSEPIKGTRPRDEDPVVDQRLARDLAEDPKDRAENIMIVDLMRNDLAKVCADGSIDVSVLCGVRSYPSVHHLHSRVEGDIKEGHSFTDALCAAFPCGSVTGAPKLAALEAIAALEGEGRGPYCGTVFAITGQRAVASVAIRTAVIDHASGRLDARSGGGVTILSQPEAEHQETLDKAYLFRTLTGGHDSHRR